MSDDLIQRVRNVIASVKRLPAEKITVDSPFQELGIDSMDAVEILFALENEFEINIPDEEAKTVHTVREMAQGIAKLIAAKSADAPAAGQ
jgi:acyl carrier protein